MFREVQGRKRDWDDGAGDPFIALEMWSVHVAIVIRKQALACVLSPITVVASCGGRVQECVGGVWQADDELQQSVEARA